MPNITRAHYSPRRDLASVLSTAADRRDSLINSAWLRSASRLSQSAITFSTLVTIWCYSASEGTGIRSPVTEQEISAIRDHLESATSIIPSLSRSHSSTQNSSTSLSRSSRSSGNSGSPSSFRSGGVVPWGTVPSFLVGRSGPTPRGSFSVFLLASLEFAGAGDMLNRVVSEVRCAAVELDHRLINMCEAQRSSDWSQAVETP